MNWNKYFYYDSTGWLFWKEDRLFPFMPAGWVNPYGYASVNIHKKVYLMHRVVWEMHNGPIKNGMQVDHIDGDRLNNKISNLRLASHNQNCHNAKTRSDNTSGVKGVTWDKTLGKWRSRIMVNKKRVNVGCFDDLELAQLATSEAREKLHENYANHGINGAWQ